MASNTIAQLCLGDEIDNDDLCTIFGCGPQGGMRRSHKTNTLVLICNHVASVYDDRWDNGVLHYTGMGQTGDQSLTFMQNRTLAESGSNGVVVHLFEVFRDKIYTYAGPVRLAGSPYSETQNDSLGKARQTWIFPLAPIRGPVSVPVEVLRNVQKAKQKVATKLSDAEIERRAKASGTKGAGSRKASVVQHQRCPWIAEHARRRAKGKCDLCGNSAPFLDGKGRPYLETHHVNWLARGGEDSIENTVALCPNCHRRMHILERESDIEALRAVIGNYKML